MGHHSIYGNVRNMIRYSIKDRWLLRNTHDVRTWSGITTTMSVNEWTNINTRRIYRSLAIHRALTRLVRKCGTWWNYTPNMVVLLMNLFFVMEGEKAGAPNPLSRFLAPGRDDTSDPLRSPTLTMMMKPTIRMAGHDPNRPMTARWGDDFTIWSLQRPF